MLQHALYLVHCVRSSEIQRRNARRHVRLHGIGQAGQKNRGIFRVQVRQDQGDGLGVLVAEEGKDLRRVGTPQEAERARSQGAGEAVDHGTSLVGAERPLQHPAGIVDPTAGCHVAPQHQLLELGQSPNLVFRFDFVQLCDFEGELLYFLFAEILEYLRGKLGAKQYEKNSRLPVPDEVPASCRLVVMPGEVIAACRADRLAVARRFHTTLSSRRLHLRSGVRCQATR